MTWGDWPLILSSVLAQLTIGAFIVLGLVIFSGRLCFGQSDRLHRTMPVFWLLLFAAIVLREADFMLQSHHESYNFTREAMLIFVFFAMALIYWFAEKALFASDALRKAGLLLVMLCGLGYLGHGVWVRDEHWLEVVHFTATTLCGGTLLAHAALVKAEHKVAEVDRYLPKLGAGIAVICFLVGVPQLATLAGDVEQSAGLFVAQALSLGMLLASVGVWLMPTLTKSKPALPVMTFALVLVAGSSFGAGIG
ncbi:DmsC/YnfH family molybdoenzyme membrane anchor subunit [Photobacterium sp. MCCC 1A19761]|uniref:DmsC/YnfH family molybdoenzyme membrane anchor subunit n=1 Tax=Photobacterium sp. MCCC 1A19761 TaxID=3115000 RepID=UPI00307D6C11